MGFTIFIIINLWKIFLHNPTVTSLQTNTHPVSEVPFPGIAICNVNKISKREAEAVGKFIANATGRDLDDILDYMKLLGGFYDFETKYSEELVTFQKILDDLPYASFNIRSLMQRLATPCDKLLKNCAWKGEEVVCSEIFKLRLTFEGWCCSFNYFKETSTMANLSRKKLLHGEATFENGLNVVANNDLDDYFLTTLGSTGVNVNIFVPTDFPDQTSGGLTANLVEIFSENFLEIVPITVLSVPDVIKYPLDKRRCTFDSEQKTIFGVYSQSDCLVNCRIKSMEALCDCVPFMIPTNSDENICSLTDIPCLRSFRSKWTALVPFADELDDENFQMEKHNALQCDLPCYPSCDTTLYRVNPDNIPLTFTNNNESTTDSFIHIYYRGRYSELYVQDVVYYWFELLSNFGGIFGITAGFSIIGALECVIYLVYKIIEFLKFERK